MTHSQLTTEPQPAPAVAMINKLDEEAAEARPKRSALGRLRRWLPCSRPGFKQEFIAELKPWSKIMGPVAISTQLRMSLPLVDLVFLGHISTEHLAAGSMALIWMNSLGDSIRRGLGEALSTLTSQAVGAGNHRLVSTWLQISFLLGTVLSILVAASWLLTSPILSVLGVTAYQRELAASFARWSVLSVLPDQYFFLMKQHLQAVEQPLPVVWIAVVAAVLNVVFNYVLINGIGAWQGLGFIGSPLATAATRWVMMALASWYVFKYRPRAAAQGEVVWMGWHRDCVKGSHWKAFSLGQALPQIIGKSLERWQIQTLSAFAAMLGAAEIATHNSMLEVFTSLSSVMFAFVDATVIRIGIHLGAGRVSAAKTVAVLMASAAMGFAVIVGLVFSLVNEGLGKLFSDDPVVWELTGSISQMLAVTYLYLAAFYTCMAILTGQGRPNSIAISFIIGGWGVCVPLAYICAHVLELGFVGIWIGPVVGYTVITLLTVAAVCTGDWQKCADVAMKLASTGAEGMQRLSDDDESGDGESQAQIGDIAVSVAEGGIELAAVSSSKHGAVV